VLSRSPKLGVCGVYRDRGAPILNLPLGVGDRPVGLVQAFPVEDSPHVRAFEKDWRPLGESLGRLLDFADRLDAYQTRLDDLEVSNQLGESLLGSIFNARDFMSKLLEVILLNTRSSVVRLDMTDETEMSESDEENVFVVQSGDQPVVQKPQLWQAVKSELIRSRYLSREGHPELLESIRASFVAGVPVDLPGRGTGMLFLARDQRQGYEERELMIARVFAEKIELFFQTASTYRLASDAYRGTVQLLVEMMDAREAQTLGHSNRVMLWSVSVGKIFGLSESEMETLRWAALFHDVGMCGIDEGIQKTQGRLADDQMDRIRQHPRLGALICDPLHLPLPVSPAILTHHERWDGRGYPNGLKGEQIPLLGRIIALAEVFNAFISPRHYRQALTLEEAAQRVLNESGISLDPSVVQAFLKALASDPVYDFLKIRNGSAALS
jgi:response regulator RpfG family c-di-GMP phosphodiesterase